MVEGREGQREQRLHRIFPPLTVVMDLAEMQFAFCDQKIELLSDSVVPFCTSMLLAFQLLPRKGLRKMHL